MASFFRRTRLYAQINEACAEYRAVRRREHRAALKMKRQLVRMQVIGELQRTRIADLSAKIAVANSAAGLAAANNVLAARRARREAMESVAQRSGAELPAVRSSADPAGVDPEADAVDPEVFKQQMAANVRNVIPESARGVMAGKLIDGMLKDSVQGVELDGKGGREGMGVELAAALARQAGLGEKELATMLESIRDENAEDVNQYLKERLLPKLRDAAGPTSPTR